MKSNVVQSVVLVICGIATVFVGGEARAEANTHKEFARVAQKFCEEVEDKATETFACDLHEFQLTGSTYESFKKKFKMERPIQFNRLKNSSRFSEVKGAIAAFVDRLGSDEDSDVIQIDSAQPLESFLKRTNLSSKHEVFIADSSDECFQTHFIVATPTTGQASALYIEACDHL